MILSLVGMRGTGKTSVGHAIASQLKWEFADSDSVIEKQIGKTIAQMFADDGEATFRTHEAEILGNLLAVKRNLVLATGGGAISSNETRRRLVEAGPIVWLTAPVDVLSMRLSADVKTSEQRPSLTGKRVVDELADVLKDRRRYYESVATIIAPTTEASPKEIANDICLRLSRELTEGTCSVAHRTSADRAENDEAIQ